MMQTILLSLFAGAMIPVGGYFACLRRGPRGDSGPLLPHTIMAFGSGALLSAVALVLVPQGSEAVAAPLAVALFAAGGVGIAFLDRWFRQMGGSHGQMLAMMTDFLPEAAALGALLAAGMTGEAYLLAGLIALQNLPEGFNAWCETEDGPPGRKLLLFCGLALLGPVAALAGEVFLADRDAALGGLMLLAAGGILYLVLKDGVPKERPDDEWLPPLGAVAGFGLGLAGHLTVA